MKIEQELLSIFLLKLNPRNIKIKKKKSNNFLKEHNFNYSKYFSFNITNNSEIVKTSNKAKTA